MRVRYIGPGKREADTLDAKDFLEGVGDQLSRFRDLGEKGGGQVVEVRVVLLRDDLGVARPDRIDVQKGNDPIVLVDGMRWHLAAGYPAENAILVSLRH